MNSGHTLLLSKKGMKELKKQVAGLERDHKEALARLRELDKTDGHDERLVRAEQLALLEVLEAELTEKKEALRNAALLPRKRDALKVAIGSVVDLLDTKGRVVRYTLVESIEADPSDGRISINSPLGRNLLGKQLRDIVEWSGSRYTNRLQLVAIT